MALAVYCALVFTWLYLVSNIVFIVLSTQEGIIRKVKGYRRYGWSYYAWRASDSIVYPKILLLLLFYVFW